LKAHELQVTENKFFKDTADRVSKIEKEVDKILERKDEWKKWTARDEIENLDSSFRRLIKKIRALYSSTLK